MNSWSDLINFAAASIGFVVALLGLLLNRSVPFIDRLTRRFFSTLFALLAAYVASNLIGTISLEMLGPNYTWLSQIGVFCESLFSSMLMPLLTEHLLRCAGETEKKSPLIYAEGALWLTYCALLVVTQFTEEIYYFTPDNVYHRGPLYPILLVPPVMMMLLNLIAFYRRRSALTRRQRQAFACYLLIPLVCMLIQMAAYSILMILIGTCTAAFLMFVFILREQADLFVRQQKKIARQQQEIARQRVSVMVLQMRPHFIYNTLMSIYSLCNQDPRKARQVTADFTSYLQKNFHAVASESPIPFSTELEHTRAYLAVEQAQHEDMLIVEYDTPFTHFRVPPLTLQPLVENAVKHGFDPYAGPLRICVRTRQTESGAEIAVSDNGSGFDPNDESRPQSALTNIRQRLELMCSGTMEITPREGGGTLVRLFVPQPKA